MKTVSLFCVILCEICCPKGTGQAFSNLNFEDAQIVFADPSLPLFTLQANEALPNWSVELNGTPLINGTIFYDIDAIDSFMVSIHDSQTGAWPPISGNYSVILQGGQVPPGITGSGAIAQFGTIPVTAKSLMFSASIYGRLDVSFDGKSLPFSITQSAATYNTYVADISDMAGASGKLTFSAPYLPHGSFVEVDDIQFSATPVVPEPGTTSLILGCGSVVWGVGRRKRLGTREHGVAEHGEHGVRNTNI